MAVDGKNFARDENITAIATDITLGTFRRTGVITLDTISGRNL